MSDKQLCDNVLDVDENEHDIGCSEPATYLCAGQPRCHQCAHDWLDEIGEGHAHVIQFIGVRLIKAEPELWSCQCGTRALHQEPVGVPVCLHCRNELTRACQPNKGAKE